MSTVAPLVRHIVSQSNPKRKNSLEFPIGKSEFWYRLGITLAQISPDFLYQQIATKIKDRILDGEFAPGGRLKSERDLAQEFGVQRNTMRQALALLQSEGRIAKDRRGSYVQPLGERAANVFLLNIHSGSAPNLIDLVGGFTRIAEPQGFQVRRRSNNPLPDSNVNVVPALDSLLDDIAGVLIWPHFPTDIAQIKRINERVPTVLVDQRILGITTDSVRFDDVEGGKVVTKHLLELGHRRIAFLTDEVFAETVQARWQGYVLAHEEAGIVCDPKLSLLYQFIDADIFEPTMRRLYNLPDTRPTAIVCSNDVVAFGLLRFLNAEGIRVPEDMAVTGYGNSMPEYTNAISLTTIDQRFFDAGQEAARILCKRIHQPTSVRMHSPLDIVLPVRLVVRGSTAGANELPDRLSNRAFDAAKPNSGQA